MTEKKHVKEYIEYYTGIWREQKLSETPMNPINGLIKPLMGAVFREIPKFWYGVDDNPTGLYGLVCVTIFGTTSSEFLEYRDEASGTSWEKAPEAKKVATVYFWYADDKLHVLREAPPANVVTIANSIDLADMTIKELIDFMMARIVASTLEGK